ncbi:class I SAM-dependent methyltransferase [Plantibacter sp. Mn2098]|uniref:class I SAM-dependent methyltransferase n=1 Tax=Plantibacter sp. Mn2098 TaxID=3395266 RepID=UPI003BD552E0
MDPRTIRAYDRDASAYADEWEREQDTPTDVYALLNEHFLPGSVADIGCGSGRDAAWLSARGFQVTGYDASEELLAEARKRHPGIPFEPGTLPALDELGTATFTNVLCETVIMHLPDEEVAPAVSRLISLLSPHGVLYLSWRVTDGSDRRDGSDRLYAAFDASRVFSNTADCDILADDEVISESSGKRVRRVILRAPAPQPHSGRKRPGDHSPT